MMFLGLKKIRKISNLSKLICKHSITLKLPIGCFIKLDKFSNALVRNCVEILKKKMEKETALPYINNFFKVTAMKM